MRRLLFHLHFVGLLHVRYGAEAAAWCLDRTTSSRTNTVAGGIMIRNNKSIINKFSSSTRIRASSTRPTTTTISTLIRKKQNQQKWMSSLSTCYSTMKDDILEHNENDDLQRVGIPEEDNDDDDDEENISMTVEEAEQSYGMPWKSSIDPSYPYDSLFYMPFWEWQLEFMKQSLTNLRVIPTISTTRTGETNTNNNNNNKNDLTYVENTARKKRMITLCFESDEYRYIRMTLLDAGSVTQVFTSLWYPRCNLPVLGIDLLQFNHQQRHLTVVDFQPIHHHYHYQRRTSTTTTTSWKEEIEKDIDDEQQHDLPYEHLMEPIRQAYPTLQHKMSKRFYDENQFFSSQMLYGKEPTPDYVWEDLMPAYKAYVKLHLDLVQQVIRLQQSAYSHHHHHHHPELVSSSLLSSPSSSSVSHLQDATTLTEAAEAEVEAQYYRKVLECHQDYDNYSSERDPAHGLLSSNFGKEYADAFVYDILFPLSNKSKRVIEKK